MQFKKTLLMVSVLSVGVSLMSQAFAGCDYKEIVFAPNFNFAYSKQAEEIAQLQALLNGEGIAQNENSKNRVYVTRREGERLLTAINPLYFIIELSNNGLRQFFPKMRVRQQFDPINIGRFYHKTIARLQNENQVTLARFKKVRNMAGDGVLSKNEEGPYEVTQKCTGEDPSDWQQPTE